MIIVIIIRKVNLLAKNLFRNPLDPFASFNAKKAFGTENTSKVLDRPITLIYDENNPFGRSFSSEVSTLSKQIRIVSQHVKQGLLVLIAQDGLGGHDEYSKDILKNILFSMSKNIELPQTIILVNTAVNLAST
jgi:hypothetical protein